MKKKAAAWILLAAMLLPSIVSCGKDAENTPPDSTDAPPESADTADSATEPEESEFRRADAKDNLPPDLKFDGESINILAMQELADYDVWGEGEESADIVYDAVYSRNLSVESRLGVTILPDIHAVKWADFATLMRNLVQGGDSTYDFFFTMGNASIQSGNDNLFLDLRENPYIDFQQDWWWSGAMEELSLDGTTIRYLVGDISLSHYMLSGCTLFNKALYTDAFGDPDALYQLVLDGGWTLDKLREQAQAAYNDANGDGVVNEGDLYGSIIGNPEMLKQLEYATDLRRYTRDDKGYVQLDYDEERAAALTQKLCALLYETQGVEYRSAYTSSKLFSNRSMMFYLERLRVALGADLREMEDDYGIIPLPKMDEEQKEYKALIHNNSEYVVIPKTAPDPARSGAVIEALCAESYRSVVEVFYEKAMKLKYSRDAVSGQCIDLISQCARKNVLYEYDGVFQCGTVVTNCVAAGNTNFASTFAKVKTTSERIMQKYMEKFEKDKANQN